MGFIPASITFLGLSGSYAVFAAAVTVVGLSRIQERIVKRQTEKARQELANTRQQQNLNFGDPAQPRRVIYGSNVRISGPVVYAHTNGPHLLMVVPLSTYQNMSIDGTRFWINGEEVATTLKAELSYYVPDGTQAKWWNVGTKHTRDNYVGFITRNSGGWDAVFGAGKLPSGTYIGQVFNQTVLPNVASEWDSTHKMTNTPHVLVYLQYNANLFQGLPNLAWQVSTTVPDWYAVTRSTANPSVALYDYLVNSDFGMGIAAADIDAASFEAARQFCDETVDGVARYELNYAFDRSETPATVINNILQSMNAELVNTGGLWSLVTDWQPSSLTISEGDLVAPIKVTTARSARDIFNTVSGIYKGADRASEPETYPTVSDSSAISSDGAVIPYNLDLPYIPKQQQAQRVARIELRKNRLQMSAIIVTNAVGLQVRAGDTISITNTRLGWSAKPFQILSWRLKTSSGLINCEMELAETSSTIWSDDALASTESVPATNLPRYNNVSTPTNLTVDEELVRQGDTYQIRITLDWDSSVIGVSRYDAQYSQDGSTWSRSQSTTESTIDILLPTGEAGNWYFRVRAVSTLGIFSDWLESGSTAIAGKSTPPNDVGAISSEWDPATGWNLTWDPVADVDVDKYEVRVGSTSDTWGSAASPNRVGTTWRSGLSYSGTFRIFVKALDTSGNYSGNAVYKDITLSVPGAVQNLTAAIIDQGLQITWDIPTNAFADGVKPIQGYQISYGAAFAGSTVIGESKTTRFVAPLFPAGSRTFWVVPVCHLGQQGTPTSHTAQIQSPDQPGNFAAVKAEGGILLTWDANSVGAIQLPIAEYQIRYGASFAAGTPVASVKGTAYTAQFFATGTRTYWIRAVDVNGNAGNSDDVSFTINAPSSVTDQIITINESDALLTFTESTVSANQLPIKEYIVKVGNTYATATEFARLNSNSVKIPFFVVDTPPSKTKYYWVVPVDIFGNHGAEVSAVYTIYTPNAPGNLLLQVVQNVIFLNWTVPNSTLPIKHYRIKRSASPTDFDYGFIDATNFRYEEPVGGTFTYKVTAIDVVGNESDISSATIDVENPGDFEISAEFTDPNYNTTGSLTADSGAELVNDGNIAIMLGMESSDSVSTHASNNGWSTPQDAIDAGYPFVAQPILAGTYTYENDTFDIGGLVAAGTITVAADRTVLLNDFAGIECQISVRATTGDSWIEFNDVWSISTVNFRYVRIRLYIETTAANQVVNMAGQGVIVRVQIAKKTEQATVAAVSTDASGTSYTLTKTFVDISEVVATVNGSSAYFAVVDWTDPNPTEVKVFVFDTSNNRVSANVSLLIRGV